jgi:molecular chaperone GrpE
MSEEIEQAATAPEQPPEAEPAPEADETAPAEAQAVRGSLTAILERLEKLEEAAATTAKQVGYLPPQVRMLGNKVEGLATSISEPRYRALLLGLLAIYDLVDQLLRASRQAPASESEAVHTRNYDVLRTQLRQLLEANGLEEIPAEGAFDPEQHRAIERATVSDPDLNNRILEVARPGFRTAQAVLRYAEVRVGHYEASAEAPASPTQD